MALLGYSEPQGNASSLRKSKASKFGPLPAQALWPEAAVIGGREFNRRAFITMPTVGAQELGNFGYIFLVVIVSYA